MTPLLLKSAPLITLFLALKPDALQQAHQLGVNRCLVSIGRIIQIIQIFQTPKQYRLFPFSFLFPQILGEGAKDPLTPVAYYLTWTLDWVSSLP